MHFHHEKHAERRKSGALIHSVNLSIADGTFSASLRLVALAASKEFFAMQCLIFFLLSRLFIKNFSFNNFKVFCLKLCASSPVFCSWRNSFSSNDDDEGGGGKMSCIL